MTIYHKPSHLCRTKFCRRKGHPKRGRLCSKCSMHRWRAANPMKARLAMLRDRAARKKVPFDLTMVWLEKFLAENAYDPKEHHIDRETPRLGYVMGNLQVMLIGENIAKGNRERHVPFFKRNKVLVDTPF